jgi:hypothetical protein
MTAIVASSVDEYEAPLSEVIDLGMPCNPKDMPSESISGSGSFERWDWKENSETREHALNHDNVTIVARSYR